MADSKKKKTADEIVEEAASEMGVEDEKVPESDESAEDAVDEALNDASDEEEEEEEEAAEEASDDEDDEDEDDEAEAEEAEDDEDEDDEVEAEEEEDDEEEEEEEAKEEKVAAKSKKSKSDKKAKAKKPAAKKSSGGKGRRTVDIFQPSENDPDVSHLSHDDLSDFDVEEESFKPYFIGGVITLIVAAAIVFAAAGGDIGKIQALFRGDLREREIAEAKRQEEEYRKIQLEKLEKFGNLMIQGNPQYATLMLDGEVQYGQTSSGEWRALRLGPSTAFQNIKVKQPHKIQVMAPGYEPLVQDLTEGMWQESPAGGQFAYQLTANLQPSSLEYKQEMDARLAPDTENEFYGSITINTTPPGAGVVINNTPVTDAEGNLLPTPMTIDRYYVKDEKTGKLEERLVQVDTVLDKGHKIQVLLPPAAGADKPKFVTSLERQMWTCTWKDEDTLKKEKFDAEKDTIQKKCNYTWDLNLDFNALEGYIKRRAEEQKRIEEQNKKFEEEMAKKRKEIREK